MSVTWLHVSDFHLRAGESYDRDTVVGALVKSVKRFRERGRAPDLLFATGDITQSGKSAEYETATAFFDALLEAAGLEKDRLFVVPGNHDVDRGRCRGLARTLESEDKSAEYFSPGEPLPHLERSQGAFVGWYNRYFDSIRAMPDDSTCGPVQQVVVDGMKVGILPINSALFAQGDDDHAKLWVGRRCLKEAVRRLEGDVRIALLHHPLEWLHDVEQANIKAELHQHVDVLLRGHLHQNDVEMVVSPSGGALHLAAGAAYQTRKWPNRALYGAFDGRCVTVFPIRYEDAPEEVWVVDPSLFPMEEGHERDFDLPRLAARGLSPGPVSAPNPPPPLFRSNIPSRGGRPFVGREELLAEIASAFSDTTKEFVLVAHGLAGVGKSELAREYARRALERYPGGAFFVDASQGAPFVDIARIGGAVLGLDFAEGLRVQEQAVRTLMALRAQPTLLIFDNVTDMEAVKEYLPAVGTPCHVLMTSLLETGGPEWRTVRVPPLPHMAGLELVEGIAGREVAQAWGEALVAQAEGLPIQLCSAAAAVAYEVHRRRTPALPPLADAASRSFGFVYSLLPEDCHVLLHGAAFLNGQRLSRGVLPSDNYFSPVATITLPHPE